MFFYRMSPYPSLISDSVLVNDTIELLEATGGRVSAVEVVDSVMKISISEPKLASLLVKDIVRSDPRLKMVDDEVELIEFDHGARKLFETDFVVFDLETTGAKAPPCRIIEIGAYKIEKGKITGEYQTLVDPEVPVPGFITQLTGISDRMVTGAPKFAQVAGEFLDFIGDAVIVAHNAMFDMHFLNHEIGRIYEGYRVANPYLCTVKLSRKLLPNLENHRLHTVAEHYLFHIKNRHRAPDDAHATAKIFVELLHLMQQHGVDDLAAAKSLKTISQAA
jgi:DNA polymerase-3 subunit alpha (Gram-positive type)